LIGRRASSTGGTLVAWNHEDTRWTTPSLDLSDGQLELSLTPPQNLMVLSPDRLVLMAPVQTRLGQGLLPAKGQANGILEAASASGTLPDAIRKIASRLPQYPGLTGWTLVLANSESIWLMHLLGEGAWAARRIPDDHMALLTDTLAISTLGPDNAYQLSSGDLEARAIQRHWFAPSGRHHDDQNRLHLGLRENRVPVDNALLDQLLNRWREVQNTDLFHLARAYTPPAVWRSPVQRSRKNRLLQLMGLGRPLSQEFSLPFSVPVREPVTVATLIAALRDYQSADPNGPGQESTQAPDSILSQQTRFSAVFEGRAGKELPASLKSRLWLAPHRPDLGPYTPWTVPLGNLPYGWETADQQHLRKKTLQRMLQNPALMERKLIRDRLRRWTQFEEDVRKHMDKQLRDWVYAWNLEPLLTQQIVGNSAASYLLRAWFLQTEWIRDHQPAP